MIYAVAVDKKKLFLPHSRRILHSDKNYEYHSDSNLRYSQDQLDNRFDRSYAYDHAGHVTEAFSGSLARGQADTDNRPYKLTYSYDAFNHLTQRTGRVWNVPNEANTGSGVYANNKNTGWQYDADGRLTDSTETEYTYDAAGRAVTVLSAEGELTQTQTFDGDGQRTKLSTQTPTETEMQYYVRSSVIKQVITELSPLGQKTRTFVYQGNQVVAWQQKFGTMEIMAWEHRDLSNASVRIPGAADGGEAAELEPLGSDAGLSAPQPPSGQQYPIEYEPTYPGFGNVLSDECRVNGINTPCEIVQTLMRAGALATESMQFSKEKWRRKEHEIIPLGVGLYQHWVNDDGTQRRDTDRGDVLVFNVNDDALGHWELAHAGNSQNPERRLTPYEVQILSGRVQQLLNQKPGCKEFIRDLINKAVELTNGTNRANSTDIMKLFNKVQSQGGFIYKSGWGQAIGHIRSKTSKVNLGGYNRFDRISAQLREASVAIHELIHHAGYQFALGDTLLYRAVHELRKAQGLSMYESPEKVEYLLKPNTPNEHTSNYWNRYLREACNLRN